MATVALATLPAAPCLAQTPAPLLSALFQDHAVLQRDAPIGVWGTAAPGATITVELADAVVQAHVDREGKWSARLPAMATGGPHTMNVRSSGGAVQAVSDILIGDVFLCSGQSNMALPVSRTLNAPSEIRAASNERIRMLKVGLSSSPVPLAAFPEPVAWEVATPATVPDWSATCYYFARELQRSVDVPIGLIDSSWGGSDIRAWTSADALAGVGGYEKDLALLRRYPEDPWAAQQGFGEVWQTWWRTRTGDAAGTEPWRPRAGEAWRVAPEGLGDWNAWGRPELRGFHGMVWFRATAELTASQAERDAVLSLGGIDEVDQTWLNGHVVGNTFGWGTERRYRIPADLLREGENVVVVNVLNTWGAGGMVGDPARRALTLGDPESSGSADRVPLEAWRYRRVPAEVGMPPRTPWDPVAGRSTLYNAMVAPLHDYGLRAVAWYQGEANTNDETEEYLALLRALIAQWREGFGEDLPVLVVQLPSYGRPRAAPTESGWAEVREAQRLAARGDPRAALVVTIDLGSVYDIHPATKREVGRRLARAVRHVVYDADVTPSGPVPVRATRRGDTVAVAFDDVVGTLVAYGYTGPVGFELCGRERGSCAYAGARIDGSRVLLRTAPEDDVVRVRYCWADSPICTLYDEAGLPAGPFELRISDGGRLRAEGRR